MYIIFLRLEKDKQILTFAPRISKTLRNIKNYLAPELLIMSNWPEESVSEIRH